MRTISAFILLFAFTLAAPAQVGQPLPLAIAVDVSGIEDIDDYPGGEDALSEKLNAQVADYFARKFPAFWRIDPNSPHHRLEIEVEVEDSETGPEFTFAISPNSSRQPQAKSIKALGKPDQTVQFDKKIKRATRKALKGIYSNIYEISEDIHKKWNFGITTQIRISRALKPDDVRRFRDDQLAINWPHAFQTAPLATAPPEPFTHELALSPSIPRVAKLRSMPHEGQLIQPNDTLAELCIRRDIPQTPQGIKPTVTYTCPVAGKCRLEPGSVFPSGWVSEACENQGFFEQLLNETIGIPQAQANTKEGEVWTVPPLEQLYGRLKNDTGTFVGFTDFEIESEQLAGLDADAYTIDVRANGVPVWVGGIPPKEKPNHFDSDDGVLIRFGLENLQFSGRTNGCEILEVRLNFFKDNKAVSEPIVLSRRYAAMRHARESVIVTSKGKFTWSGVYQSPAKRKESGLFLKSSGLFFKDSVGAKEEARAARDALNELRNKLDSFNWTIRRGELGGTIGNAGGSTDDILKLVGKLRPPTKAKTRPGGDVAYGLLIGTEQPNGQLQFSFDWEQIENLRRILLRLRESEPTAKDVVPARVEDFYPYTYSEARKNAPNWVCHL